MTTTSEKSRVKSAGPARIVSTQLNILTRIDVAGATRSGGLDGHAALIDNSGDSTGEGTAQLRTVCRQGQVLNWLVYCADMNRRLNGSWPPFARISNIVMLQADGAVQNTQVCTNLKVYGSVDKVRSPLVPVYSYWAGIVRPDLPPGVYPYRLIIECSTEDANKKQYFNLDGPSLEVLPLDSPA